MASRPRRASPTCSATASACTATPIDNKLEEGQSAPLLRRAIVHAERAVRAGDVLVATRTSLMTRRARWSRKRAGGAMATSSSDSLFDPIGMTSASVDRAGLQSAKSWARGAQRRAAADRGQRRLLRRPGGGRGQQQHQGHDAVDAGADGRDARRARARNCSRRSTRRASRRPTSAARMRKFLERLGRSALRARLAQLRSMPATASSATAAGSTAIAR